MATITPVRAQATLTPAELASRIEIPLQLPVRSYDGERIQRLSKTGYELWVRCREAWRRRYLLGEREPAGGAMFLGSRVDDTMSHYYRTLLDIGEPPPLDRLQRFYDANWSEQLQREQDQRGLDWAELDEVAAFRIGREAVATCVQRLVPQLGEPVAVQRRFEFKLHPATQWAIEGYTDLEVRRYELGSDEPIEEVVDWKVKGRPVHQDKADRDVQASVYLAGRWIEGRPAQSFAFAQVLRPGPQRQKLSTKITRTSRTVGELRAVRARLALAAAEIVRCDEQFGPERPWGYADPTSWGCSPRFCPFWTSCPGGAGL